MSVKTSVISGALRIIARDIQSDDGVANMACVEAADRLDEQARIIGELLPETNDTEIKFACLGQPRPKGNMRAISIPGRKYSQLIDGTKGLKAWSNAIRDAAMVLSPETPWVGPVRLDIEFFMGRPKTLPKKTTWMVKKPDIDKLIRAVNDSLSGIIYVDDSQVVKMVVSKKYGGMPGIAVAVSRLGEFKQKKETK